LNFACSLKTFTSIFPKPRWILFKKADKDGDVSVSFEEFIALAYNLITSNDLLESAAESKQKPRRDSLASGAAHRALVESLRTFGVQQMTKKKKRSLLI
jgi:hypothetical protein